MQGEVTAEIFEQEVTARIDFAVLKKIEERVNVVEYIGQMRFGEPYYSKMAWILYCAFGTKLRKTENDIGNWCIDNLSSASEISTEIILQLVKPQPENKKKVEETPTKKKGLK